MASRQLSQGASKKSRRPEQVSATASTLHKEISCRPLRRSARLNRLVQPSEMTPQVAEQSPTTGKRQSVRRRPQSSARGALILSDPLQNFIDVSQPRGQKRSNEGHGFGTKRRRTSNASLVPEDQSQINRDIDPIDYWRRSGNCWPQGDWSKIAMETDPVANHLLARKMSLGSRLRKRSIIEPFTEISSSSTPSSQKSSAGKSAPYRHPGYETLLSAKNSFMDEDDLGIVDSSKELVRKLLKQEQQVPLESLFRDDIFEATCDKIKNKNETRVIRDISLLIVPSAETLATYGAKELVRLTESTNEGWKNSIPVTVTRPQPDYAVGFRREAFTEEQLTKLQPFVGGVYEQSFFMATYYLYFPFLTCEVRCGAGALDIADRQNAHSMTIAVRGVVELFRLVKREKELDRKILAFSISHTDQSVNIYGHYAVIEERNTKFYRHTIRKFNFTDPRGKDKWTAYKFTVSVYHTWMPSQFEKICSAIDAIPADINFEISQQSEPQFPEQTEPSQDRTNQNLSALNTELGLSTRDKDSQLQPLDPFETPSTSITKDLEQKQTKKAKRARR